MAGQRTKEIIKLIIGAIATMFAFVIIAGIFGSVEKKSIAVEQKPSTVWPSESNFKETLTELQSAPNTRSAPTEPVVTSKPERPSVDPEMIGRELPLIVGDFGKRFNSIAETMKLARRAQ